MIYRFWRAVDTFGHRFRVPMFLWSRACDRYERSLW